MTEAYLTGRSDLRRCWDRWTSVVELFAHRRGGRYRISRQQYESLHAELLASCRALATNGEEAERPFYEGLETLAQPWLSSHTLEQTDREILFDLLARCRQVEGELQPRSRLHAVLRWAVVAGALVTCAVLVTLLAWTAKWIRFPTQEWVQGRWQAVWSALRPTLDAPWWVFPAALAILTGVVVVWRSARTWSEP